MRGARRLPHPCMEPMRSLDLLGEVRAHARRLPAAAVDNDLLRAMAARRIVLLGEASHGTQEFYAMRARLTQVLVEQHGCRAVVIEGDWPDAWRINRWVRGLAGGSAHDALAGFERFPTWMWRNTV